MIEPIPQRHLERARRVGARHLVVAMVQCMADTDASFATIAQRIDRPENEVRGWVHALVEGSSVLSLDEVSDFMLSMGAELAFSVRPAAWLNEPEQQADAAQATP